MHPIPILLTLATLLVPAAAANEDDPYYVKVVAGSPEFSPQYDASRDCASREGPQDALGSAAFALEQVAPPFNPLGGPSLERTVPRCVAFDSRLPRVCGDTACLQARNGSYATFAYEVGSGNYTVRLFSPLYLAGTSMRSEDPGASGNSGLGILFDCWNCPPP